MNLIGSNPDSDENFHGYEPTTDDPGWSLTYGVLIICTLLNLGLPLLVRCRRSTQRQTEEKLVTQPTETSTSGSPQPKKSPQNVVASSSPAAAKGSFPAPPSLVADDQSVASEHSAVSSALGSAVNAVLDATTRKGHVNQHARITSANHFNNNNNNQYGSPKSRPKQEKRVEGKTIPNDTMTDTKSVLSVLDHDAVSMRDALDSHEGHVPGKYVELDETKSLLDRCLEIADWDEETTSVVKLFVPYIVQGSVGGLFSMVNVAVIGHFIGVREANVYVMVGTLMGFTGTIYYGFSAAVGTLAPQADGAGNNVMVGRYLQLSIILYTLFSIPSNLVWAFWTKDAMLWFGYDPTTADLAQQYVYPYLCTFLIDGAEACIFEFLDVMGHEKYATGLSLFDSASSTLIYIVMATLGVKDIVLLSIVQALRGSLLYFGNICFVVYRGWLNAYWEGLITTFALGDRRAIRTMLITAVPLSLNWILTYGEWEVLTVFAAAMGPAEVSAWGLLGYLWSSFEYITGALGDAAAVRVGFQMGAGRPRRAKLAAYKSIYLSLIISVFSSSLLFVLAEQIPYALTPDPTLQRMIFDLLPLLGFGQIFMAIGTVCWSIVGAQGRVRLATSVEMMTSWMIVIPLSAVAVFVLNYNLVGPVAALVVGYTCGRIVLSFLLLTSDWRHHSDIVVSRNEKIPSVDSTDASSPSLEAQLWKNMSQKQQKAAVELGWSKKMWEEGSKPACRRKEWSELSRAEKEAARTVGYTEEIWNNRDDSEISSSDSSTGSGDDETS